MRESPITFTSQGKWLSGIIHHAASTNNQTLRQGVLIVVGGPQTRVGSHRQFILLARRLANAGYTTMRFDYHGMGDSEGEVDTFLNAAIDIKAALDEFKCQIPEIKQFALWGLCDAASANLLFLKLYPANDVNQVILLNPWVTTQQLQAKTKLKYYYLNKLIEPDFWKNLLSFNVDIKQSLIDLCQLVKALSLTKENSQNITGDGDIQPDEDNYVSLMKQGWKNYLGRSHVILSTNDIVAAEFRQLAAQDNSWNDILNQDSVTTSTIEKANHTFSSAKWREEVENITLEQLAK